MKRLLFVGVACALLLSPRHAAAQIGTGDRGSFPGCPTCGVVSYVDFPKNEATVSRDSFTLKGWGFEWLSGDPVRRIEVWYQDYNGVWHPLPQPEGTLSMEQPRPDVWKVYQPYSPNVSPQTGWSLQLANTPPAGLRRIVINVWHDAYKETHYRTYLVKD